MRLIEKAFSCWSKAWISNAASLTKSGIPQAVVYRFVEWRRETNPSAMLRMLQEENIHVIFRGEEDYPSSLANTSDPPDILFLRGEALDIPAVSLVGTRRMSAYGKRCVEMIVPSLAQSGLLIVSGMALGVDAAVHEQALRAGGKTLAILGTGVDEASLYPRENVALAHRILDGGGAVVSEFPPETGSRKEHFPIRNRVIAGWSLATIVVEAREGSGSLITARCALEENREVLAVPGPIWSEGSLGPNQLLKNGARPCTSAEDILEAIALDRPALVAKARAELPLDPQDRALVNLLKEPTYADDLARQLGLSSQDVSGRLAILELKSIVKPIGGQMWIKG